MANEIEPTKIKIFNNQKIRTVWDVDKEDWWFSAVDVVNVLAESESYKQAQSYWTTLKSRLKDETGQFVTNCDKLKLPSIDGKYYEQDVLNTKGVLHLVQIIPSKKAAPFRVWLAQLGDDRINEMADPEKGIVRNMDYYRAKGYTDGWIKQRLQSIEMRRKLTAEWQNRGVTTEKEYAILTNEMTKAWSGMTVQEYKQFKNLHK